MQDYHLGETGEPVRMAPLQAEVKWKHWTYPVWEDASSRVEPRIIFVPDCAFCMVRGFFIPCHPEQREGSYDTSCTRRKMKRKKEDIKMDKEEKKEYFLSVYRHSLAHILAKAVMEIFGKDQVQITIGPQIADGAYYDFELPRTVTQDDFKTIEDKMREIIKRREDWTRKEVSRAEALEIFKDQRFKVELINDLPEDEVISIYYTGDDFVDLCRGPHISNSQELMNVAFQVKSASGSYWRGDENRDRLQRIYIYAFPNKDELKAHLNLIKEAMERK